MSKLKRPRRERKFTSAAHRHSGKQESGLAKTIRGKVVPRSGAGMTKGDVRINGLCRIECKCTTKPSFSINQALLDKIGHAAMSAGEIPALVVRFIDDKENTLNEVAVLRVADLETLLSLANHEPV